jgi:hypothetical protein
MIGSDSEIFHSDIIQPFYHDYCAVEKGDLQIAINYCTASRLNPLGQSFFTWISHRQISIEQVANTFILKIINGASIWNVLEWMQDREKRPYYYISAPFSTRMSFNAHISSLWWVWTVQVLIMNPLVKSACRYDLPFRRWFCCEMSEFYLTQSISQVQKPAWPPCLELVNWTHSTRRGPCAKKTPKY